MADADVDGKSTGGAGATSSSSAASSRPSSSRPNLGAVRSVRSSGMCGMGRGKAFDGCLRNISHKRVSDTKELVCHHSAVPTEILVARHVGCVVFDGGFECVIVIVYKLCGGEVICGDGIDVRGQMIVALRYAIERG